MLRLASFSTLLALAAVVVTTQGCAAGDGGAETSPENDLTATSSSPDTLINVPFYFSIPKSEVTVALNRNAYSYPTLWNKSIGNENAGLRIIAIQQAGQSPGQKAPARLDMGRQLGKAGVMQDGDLALTFRPELAGTMAYPHIQEGITHASLVYVENGVAKHLDEPLDDVTTGNGDFTTEHFVGGNDDKGVDALQVVRPVGLTDARKVQLKSWIGKVVAKRGTLHAQLGFQSNYLTPIFSTKNLTTQQTVTKLGQIILRADTSTDLSMYCSEFAWHMLALSNCSESDILQAGPAGASCVAPIFAPMPLIGTESSIGLGEGPLRLIETAPAAGQAALLPEVFKTGNATGLSSGHRKVAQQLQDMGLIAGLQQYYTGKIAGAPADQLAAGAAKMNAAVAPNYSPTAFMAQALMDKGVRPMDYVATVVFVDSAADYAKAKALSANPTP